MGGRISQETGYIPFLVDVVELGIELLKYFFDAHDLNSSLFKASARLTSLYEAIFEDSQRKMNLSQIFSQPSIGAVLDADVFQ